MARLTDFDSVSFPEPETNKLWEPIDLSKSVAKMVKAREDSKLKIDDVMDTAVEFGYELGEASVRAEVAEKLDTLRKRASEGDLVLEEALAFMATLLVKDEDEA